MYGLVIIFLGGGAGAVCRHLAGVVGIRLFGSGFPVGTVFVNIFGSLLMGLLIGWLVRRGATSNEIRLLLATGFLGGFTTFSAFSLDFANLWSKGEAGIALFYAGLSVLGALMAVFLGLWLVRQLAPAV